MTTIDSPAPLIEDLFCKGHSLEHIIGVGLDVGWSREDVIAVLRDRQWDLDGSGRLPRSKRITSPQGLRAPWPSAPTASPARPTSPRARDATPRVAERDIVDAPPLDDWSGPADSPAERQVDVEQPPAALYTAIADWDDDLQAGEEAPAPEDDAVEPPAAAATPRPRRVPAVAPDTDAAVARFLAQRTVPAEDDCFLPGPDLREAYEAWRGPAGAPPVTAREFGRALTARYGKKQATVAIDCAAGRIKPICYHGLAWKPDEASAEAPPQVSVDPGAICCPSGRPTSCPTAAAPAGLPADLLAQAREHPNRRVRAAAHAVEQAVDALCAALKRVS